jgi:uncharacterized protein
MPHVDAHQPGTPCWLELTTTDTAAAKTFYQPLLGWSYFDSPMGPDMPPYILARVQDQDVAAMFSMRKEMRDQGTPPFWLVYFSVADVDQMASKVTSLGGALASPPFDVPDAGRMVVCMDPSGGHFALWQAGKHPGARLVGDTGSMCWVELQAREETKSQKFYTSLFGWTAEKMSMGGPIDYIVFKNGDISVAGMMPNPAGAEDNVPQNWLGYFTVADCDGTTDKAKASGGQVFVSPQSVPMIGRFAVLADTQGAAFGILQPEASK